MARKFKNEKDKWVEFPTDKEIKFLIKPFTVLYLSKMPTEENLSPELMWEIFNNSVLNWKGIQGDDGKDLKCDKVNRRLVAEKDLELLSFVVSKALKSVVDEKTVKNLQKSAGGVDPKVE